MRWSRWLIVVSVTVGALGFGDLIAQDPIFDFRSPSDPWRIFHLGGFMLLMSGLLLNRGLAIVSPVGIFRCALIGFSGAFFSVQLHQNFSQINVAYYMVMLIFVSALVLSVKGARKVATS